MAHKNILSILFLMLPLVSFAHEGHGFVHGNQIAHYLTSPMHAVPLALAVIAGFWMYSKRKKIQRTNL